jgi:hypothetical protein
VDLLQFDNWPTQIVVAVGIIAAALVVVRTIQYYIGKGKKNVNPVELYREVNELVTAIRQGDPVASCQPSQVIECGERFDALEDSDVDAKRERQKIHAAVGKVDQGLREVMDHLTNGSHHTSRPPVSDNIDDEPTGDSL